MASTDRLHRLFQFAVSKRDAFVTSEAPPILASRGIQPIVPGAFPLGNRVGPSHFLKREKDWGRGCVGCRDFSCYFASILVCHWTTQSSSWSVSGRKSFWREATSFGVDCRLTKPCTLAAGRSLSETGNRTWQSGSQQGNWFFTHKQIKLAFIIKVLHLV